MIFFLQDPVDKNDEDSIFNCDWGDDESTEAFALATHPALLARVLQFRAETAGSGGGRAAVAAAGPAVSGKAAAAATPGWNEFMKRITHNDALMRKFILFIRDRHDLDFGALLYLNTRPFFSMPNSKLTGTKVLKKLGYSLS